MTRNIDVVFSCDTTGSMSPCIAEARRRIKETIELLFDANPGIRIGMIFHGDYCDEGRPYIITGIDLSRNVKQIVDFVQNTRNTCGGDWDECYEKVLHHARFLDWRSDADSKVLVMVGDALPHRLGYTYGKHRNTLDWKVECQKLNDSGINVYAVQAMADVNSHNERKFWETMARMGGGKYLKLNQLAHIIQLIQGVCFHLEGDEALARYEKSLKDRGMMNRNIALILDGLAGRKVSSFTSTSRTTLDPVAPSRFQILHIDADCGIRDFVNSTGAKFQIGKGFYQFTKRETVQERKEVVLVDRDTGDMWSGSEARELIGLPYGTRGRISPTEVGYDIYIQSTSWNRKLKKGTKFLYETDRI